MKHKIEKLPLVDEHGNLKVITIKDIEKAVQYPNLQDNVDVCFAVCYWRYC